MSVKSCEKLEKNEVALTIEVGAEAFEAGVEKAYHQKRKDIRVPGFRPGKAPRQLIEKMYGAQVFYPALSLRPPCLFTPRSSWASTRGCRRPRLR